MPGFFLKQLNFKRLLPFVVLAVVVLALLAWRYGRSPRAWAIEEVPVAFWAWQTDAPSDADVREAVSETGARTLFLRAGQIDFESEELRRIRAVKGAFPRGIEIHLVYNATRSFLSEFERLKPDDMASAVSETYREDFARASQDGARVVGMQLDIDSPTRLLPHYARLLQEARSKMPPDTKLSITGLPTWMDSPAIEKVLAQVDFWIPQLYGSRIPNRLDDSLPIASPQEVARAIERARRLDRPFYAGLAAYGYAVHYARAGELLGLRGDLDPALVANNSSFELMERKPFEAHGLPCVIPQQGKDGRFEPVASHWRYVYRARREVVIDGLAARAGEYLMLDLPSAGSLRENARIIRRRAGGRLLGLCIFRLPVSDDPTTLTVKEIAAALSDRDPLFAIDVQVESEQKSDRQYQLSITITNSGAARSRMGEGAMSVALRVPEAKMNTFIVRAVRLNGFASYESLCAASVENGSDRFAKAHPCGMRRANALRLMALTWEPGASAQAMIEMTERPPATLTIEISVTADDGRELRIEKTIKVERELSDEP